MEITRLPGPFGVEIRGLDPARLDPSAGAALRQAVDCERLAVVRSGVLSPEEQIAILSLLGPVLDEDGTGRRYGEVSNKPESFVWGEHAIRFHADYQFTPGGAAHYLSLHALRMERSEPTLYADLVGVLRRLPPGMRARLEKMSLVQAGDYTADINSEIRIDLARMQPGQEAQFPHMVQPVIIKHPYTGEEVLNVSGYFTAELVGLSREESLALLEEIDTYVDSPDHLLAVDYQAGDLVIWDNIALQHGRRRLAPGSTRRLRRVAVNPVPVADMLAGVRPDPRYYTERDKPRAQA